MKHNIFGTGFDYDPTDYNEILEGYIDTGDTSTLFTKEEFRESYEADNFQECFYYNFKFKVEAINMEAYEGKGIAYTLSLVVSPKSLCKDKLESVAASCCVDESDVDYRDIADCGYEIVFANKIYEEDKESDVEYRLNCIATVIPLYRNILFGFSMDAYKNRIGNTGWDYLEEYLLGEDSLKKALNRFKNNQ